MFAGVTVLAFRRVGWDVWDESVCGMGRGGGVVG